MNDWYIDRSKNFYYDGFDIIIEKLATVEKDVSANELIALFDGTGLIAPGNQNAAFTRFRDHGLMREGNKLGESALDYSKRIINKDELIIDLFLKRPAKKRNSPNIKPFVAICKVFDIMFSINTDPDDVFLTFSECYKYLYPCDSYDEITYELVDKIISNREYEYGQQYPKPNPVLPGNEDTNLSIWFNALKETPVFMPQDNDRNVLIPNAKQKEFFRFISVNSDEFSITPTGNNSELYAYYCSRDTGLMEVFPKVIIKNVEIDKESDIAVLFDYLFGYKKIAGFNYQYYLKYECFGIFFPFITLPRLPIRHIQMLNKPIGESLFNYISSRGGYYEDLINKGDNEYAKTVLHDNAEWKMTVIYRTKLNKDFPYNHIVFGAPGTGKSFTVNKDLKELLGADNDNDYERVTFHPDYSYANFVGSYKPVPIKDESGNESITYKYVPGPFMRVYVNALKNALTESPKPFLLVVEEINRANVAAVFGDVFQLLDRDKYGVSEYPIQASEDIKAFLAEQLGGTPEDYAKIRIPNNMFIWATMNSADQGVFPMDTAFRRRWDFTYIGIDDRDEEIRGKYVLLGKDSSQKVEWNKLRKAINRYLTSQKINEDKQLGPYFISRNVIIPENGDEIDKELFSETFKSKVIMYLFEDAAKQKRPDLFSGCGNDRRRYSDICKLFDEIGVNIFNSSIVTFTETSLVPAFDNGDTKVDGL
ncbi:MAG: AAA family ATPase [Firmicutes bacterium]|nr:AAA family ATPase [Bacillota bacterium]